MEKNQSGMQSLVVYRRGQFQGHTTFINDIAQGISSKIRLFADDCIIYRGLQTKDDETKFQEDLDRLVKWANMWGMRFNASKCKVMRISRRRNPGNPKYVMLGETLEEVTSTQYLGINIQNGMRNFSGCPKNTANLTEHRLRVQNCNSL